VPDRAGDEDDGVALTMQAVHVAHPARWRRLCAHDVSFLSFVFVKVKLGHSIR